MAFQLAQIAEESGESETLTIKEAKKSGDHRLAVAETSTHDIVLVRERERGVKQSNGKRDKSKGTERFWKRTSSLRDFRDAIKVALIDVGA